MKLFAKSLLLGALAAACATTALAVPARRTARTVHQPDGTALTVTMMGDERSHCLVTLDGLRLGRAADGSLCYMTREGLSAVRAADPARRTPDERRFVAAEAVTLQQMPLQPARAPRKAASADPAQPSDAQIPSVGSPRVPIILVAFKDTDFLDADPHATYEEFFNGNGKSTLAYFMDQSQGRYTPQFDVYGPVTLPKNARTYGRNDVYGYDVGAGKMVADAITELADAIDYSNYDNDNDGEADTVIVLYAGYGEADSYDEDTIWPCQWELDGSDYGKKITRNATVINRFAVFNEVNGFTNRVDGIGTFCHEFSHCLGLPDFYDTRGTSKPNFGMDTWSLMDYGCYADDGYTPVGYTAYEKSFMGWMTLEEGQADTKYRLQPLTAGLGDRAVRLTNDADPNEYFILEHRTRQGWDAYLPADGLLIYHVAYNADVWASNTVNNQTTKQRMTPVPADNQLSSDNLEGDLWPYAGKCDFTNTTQPAAKVYTGSLLSKPVTRITRMDDGRISFWVMQGLATQALPAPVLSAADGTLSWDASDEPATYTLEIAADALFQQIVVSADRLAEPAYDTTGLGIDSSDLYYARVKAVPVADGEFTPSAWSATLALEIHDAAIDTVTADSAAAPAVWFDLQGRPVAAPAGIPAAPGLYLRRQGTTVTKTLIR